MPNCKPGDLAIISGKNQDMDGMVVKVINPVGRMISCGDHYHYLHRGIDVMLVSTNAWIVEGDFGTFLHMEMIRVPDCPVEDKFLIPIRPSDEKLDKITKFEDDLAQKLKDNLMQSSLKKQFDKAKT